MPDDKVVGQKIQSTFYIVVHILNSHSIKIRCDVPISLMLLIIIIDNANSSILIILVCIVSASSDSRVWSKCNSYRKYT